MGYDCPVRQVFYRRFKTPAEETHDFWDKQNKAGIVVYYLKCTEIINVKNFKYFNELMDESIFSVD